MAGEGQDTTMTMEMQGTSEGREGYGRDATPTAPPTRGGHRRREMEEHALGGGKVRNVTKENIGGGGEWPNGPDPEMLLWTAGAYRLRKEYNVHKREVGRR
jgi:hypothetical protein